MRVWRLITGTDVAEVTKVEHRFIYDAVRARDPDLARSSVAMHIARGETSLQRLLEEDMQAASVVGGRRPSLVS